MNIHINIVDFVERRKIAEIYGGKQKHSILGKVYIPLDVGFDEGK